MFKTYLILWYLLIISIPSYQQTKRSVLKPKGFVINGYIKGLRSPFIYLARISDTNSAHFGGIPDSAAVINGRFRFTGVTSVLPSKAGLFLRDSTSDMSWLSFYLENAVITITGRADSLQYARVKGSATQLEYMEFEASTDHIYERMSQMGKAAEQAQDTAVSSRLQSDIEKLFAQYVQYIREYAGRRPGSVLSLDLLSQVAGYNNTYTPADYREFMRLIENLSPPLLQSPKGRYVHSRMLAVTQTLVGAVAPDFALPDTTGKLVRLSEFKGRYVLLDFWASWCAGCREENPNVVKAYQSFKDKGFVVLGVSLDERITEAMWRQAIVNDHLTWTNVCDLKGREGDAVRKYGVRGIPNNFLIDPDGRIVARSLRGVELTRKLEEVFAPR
ncbi:MAG: AhpC/TSA family protein [Chitinophagaceae bacterium]|nr:AhpC/TSA family protein [Chitinophagaceae bacterium]